MSGRHLPLVAFDWSGHGLDVTFDGEHVTPYTDVDALLDTLDEPHLVVCEATVESYFPHLRERFLERAEADGHQLRVFHPRHTARARKRWGIPKTDQDDAKVIHRLATEGRLHLSPVVPPDPAWVARRDAANEQYVKIRLSGRKDELVADAADVLGPFAELDQETQVVLGNGRKLLTSVVAATYFAAQWARNRGEFDRLLGLHGSAYPSILRSEIHQHGFFHARKRGITWQQYRRQLRRAYATFKQARIDAGIEPGGDHLPFAPEPEPVRDLADDLTVLLDQLAESGEVLDEVTLARLEAQWRQVADRRRAQAGAVAA